MPDRLHRAALAAFARGQYDEALVGLARAARAGSGGASFHYLSIMALLGRFHEVRDHLATAPFATVQARAADLFAQRGNPVDALVAVERAIALAPRSAALAISQAEIFGALEQVTEAGQELDRGVGLSRRATAYVVAAGAIALELGLFSRGEAWLNDALRDDPTNAVAHDRLGHLALFRGDAATARAHAAAIDADTVAAQTLFGAAHVLESAGARGDDLDGALAHFDRAISYDAAAYEARTWRAGLALARGDPDAALADLDGAIAAAPGLALAARMIRHSATFRGGYFKKTVAPQTFGEVDDTVAQIVPGAWRDARARNDVAATIAVVERAVVAMRGNRTLHATYVNESGVLVRLRAAPGPRYASRSLLNSVATAPTDRVLTGFEALIARYPDSALPRTHRAELFSWLGRYEDARQDLVRTIREFPATRWAYIGLAAVETLTGTPERALETLERGIRALRSTGSSVYVYRGEALRCLGRHDEALGDLEQACRLHPQRIGAWINLALARHAVGDAVPMRAAFARLEGAAQSLVYDASRLVGATDDVPELLRAMLDMMRGNRASSLVTYFPNRDAQADGALRVVAGAGPRISMDSIAPVLTTR